MSRPGPRTATEIAFTHHRADGTSEVDLVSAAGGPQHTISAGMGDGVVADLGA